MRVGAAGICGSDLHVYRGRETGLDPGTVMGHELAGEVIEVGAAVRQLHSYSTPAILVLPIESVDTDYEKWLLDATEPQ